MKPLFDEQTKALFQVGFIKPIDFVFALLLVAAGITSFFWAIFGTPTLRGFEAILLSAVTVTLVWLVILVYRCLFHVIQARSEINLMPDSAAKLAISYQVGGRE